MPNDVVHFAIHADDCERAKTFYTTVFGWSFQPRGPPGFWLVRTSDTGIRGALHQLRGPPPVGMGRYECTVSVADVHATAAAIEAAGGTLQHPPFNIPGVGTVVQFRDSEGNISCAMQYEAEALG